MIVDLLRWGLGMSLSPGCLFHYPVRFEFVDVDDYRVGVEMVYGYYKHCVVGKRILDPEGSKPFTPKFAHTVVCALRVPQNVIADIV